MENKELHRISSTAIIHKDGKYFLFTADFKLENLLRKIFEKVEAGESYFARKKGCQR